MGHGMGGGQLIDLPSKKWPRLPDRRPVTLSSLLLLIISLVMLGSATSNDYHNGKIKRRRDVRESVESMSSLDRIEPMTTIGWVRQWFRPYYGSLRG
eukprot:scaffold2078_cov103-Skeletonema_dohrnii-CCMP3373.AAC.1